MAKSLFPRMSRFEWAVIAAVAGAALIAIIATEAQSERLAMTLAIRNMRSGLNWAVAERLMRGEESRLTELVGANPLQLLDRRSAYQGVNDNWHFDNVRHELVYQPRIRAAFGWSKEFRWRIEGTSGPNGRATGLRLVEAPPPAMAQ